MGAIWECHRATPEQVNELVSKGADPGGIEGISWLHKLTQPRCSFSKPVENYAIKNSNIAQRCTYNRKGQFPPPLATSLPKSSSTGRKLWLQPITPSPIVASFPTHSPPWHYTQLFKGSAREFTQNVFSFSRFKLYLTIVPSLHTKVLTWMPYGSFQRSTLCTLTAYSIAFLSL